MIKTKIKLIGNCDAASDIIGALLLTSIAVLAFSTASVFILSTYQGATDTPHVDVDGWVDVESDVITLRHSGGEIVNSDEIRIILDINGERKEVSPEQVRLLTNSDTWELGDSIVISSSDLELSGIDEGDYIEAAIVHTASRVVIKSGTLLEDDGGSGSGNGGDGDLINVTPFIAYSYPGGENITDKIQAEGDGKYANYTLPGFDYDNETYFRLDFYLNRTQEPNEVLITIVHKEHSASDNPILSVWEQDTTQWTNYSLTSSPNYSTDIVNVSDTIDTLNDINNLKITYMAYDQGQNPNGKMVEIDYIAISVS